MTVCVQQRRAVENQIRAIRILDNIPRNCVISLFGYKHLETLATDPLRERRERACLAIMLGIARGCDVEAFRNDRALSEIFRNDTDRRQELALVQIVTGLLAPGGEGDTPLIKDFVGYLSREFKRRGIITTNSWWSFFQNVVTSGAPISYYYDADFSFADREAEYIQGIVDMIAESVQQYPPIANIMHPTIPIVEAIERPHL